jgi:uncharacterized protein
MHVAEIWRYPVKSMAGESLIEAIVQPTGIVGDRLVQVYGPRETIVTARTHSRLLGHRATLAADGEPSIDGRSWRDPQVLAAVQQIVGPGTRLVKDEDPDARFDILPLLVATDGAIAAFARDRRRLRPNIVIGGVTGLDERRWPGRVLQIGDVEIAIDSLRGRCVVTTFDPDSLEQDHGVLRDIVNRFDGRLALNASVVRPGVIRVGQAATLVDRPAVVSHNGADGISTISS